MAPANPAIKRLNTKTPFAEVSDGPSECRTECGNSQEGGRSVGALQPSARVQRLDLVGEVVGNDPPPELHRRRDLVLLGGEVAREDREALHLLEGRLVLVPGVDDLLHDGLYVRSVVQLRSLGLVQRDQRGEIRPPITSACETYCDAFSAFSMFCGATFLPCAVTMMSVLRSVIVRKPSSIEPMSPVCSQRSSSSTSRVASSSL